MSIVKEENNDEVPDFLQKEDIIDPDCIYMLIGGQIKINELFTILEDKVNESDLKDKMTDEHENLSGLITDLFKQDLEKLDTTLIK